MNMMIVSVTERTREIGLRMSLGAKRRDIRNQFLIEASSLSMVGGTIGLLIGLLFGLILSLTTGLPLIITYTTVLVPFLVSIAIGMLFGFYPAARAARLDPIVALHTA